ncbi:hypothetical protein E6H13_10005, partial [Candidatus Bathyarchaeota archaeon]
MTTQLVETLPAAETEFQYLGGSENIGSKGGHHNIKVYFADLWKFDCVQRWLRKRAPTTRAEYLSKFEKFLAWTSKEINVSDPDGLIAWARRQPNGIIVQDLIDAYGETQTPGTAHIVTAAVRGFLGRNGYRDLPKIDWTSTMSYAEGYRRADIQQLLGYLSMPTHK